MNTDINLDVVMKSIDVYGRLAYGGQCVAAMAMLAGPVLFVTCAILPFYLWNDNRFEALLYWLGGWAVAIGVAVGGAAFGAFCWRWSGDWITEWPGYAVGFGIAGVANAALAYMLTSTPIPAYLSFATAMGASFAAGALIAGHLGGMQVLAETRQQRQRTLARRR